MSSTHLSQAIYEDLVLSFCNQGLLKSHLGPRVNQSHQVFFTCRFPSELRTLQNHKDLFVISEDDLEPIHTALAGTQYISVVLFQVQTHIQEKIIQLYRDAPKLSFVCLFHECFVNAVCFDLITAVCTALRRHLGRVRCISRYQDFTYAPFGQTKKVTKSIYFIMLHSSFTTCGFEVISQNLEYAETRLCNSAILTSTVQERIKSMSGVVRFRVHRTGIPVQATLGVTDRCCITFCISVSKIKELAVPLEQVYQSLRTEAGHLEKQELQRIVPNIWISGKNGLPSFFAHQTFVLIDFRKYAKQSDTKIQNRVQQILIAMDIPYHFQKRSVLALYASGMLLESFRQALFYEDIVLPFGKEEGCLQCKIDSNVQPDSWQIELQIVGSTQYEAYQIEDDGTLLDNNGDVIPDLVYFLAQEYDASNIRAAIVHMQGKGQQKVVAILAKSSIQPLIPSVIKDHQGADRILHYKQPDVFSDPQMSNVHVKEMRADHHIISQAKGINQHARISAFIPFPRNELSRRRFSRVRSINVCVSRNDALCTILDEAVPVCLVNHELATHEAACLLEFLLHKQPILNHHSAFLSCSLNCPEQPNQGEELKDGLLKLPNFPSIVHCHLGYNQILTIHQPRFEDGQVSRCISNSLQLVVYERTDIIFFLTGQFVIFDLFETAPKGRVLASWKVPDNSIPANYVSKPAVSTASGPDLTTKDFAWSRVKENATSKVQSTEQKCPTVGRQTQQVIVSPQRVTSPAAGDIQGIAKYEICHIHSSSEHHSRLQGTTPTKRAHSSFEALRKKVPVPKLPGASDIHKMPISQSEKTASLGHRATGETRLQPQVQDKVPTSSTNLDRSYKGLLSHNDDHPLASIAKHDSFSPSARSCENNFPDLANIVAPTQIDIDLTSDISRTSQEEITRSSYCDQKEVCHDNGNNNSPAEEINTKEPTICSDCPKEIKHPNIHNHMFGYSQTLPQALQGADSDDRPMQSHAFSPEWAKDLCQFANYSPTELQQSCVDVHSTSSLGKSLPYSAPYVPQEIDGSLDKSLIDEIDMLGSEEAKETKEGTRHEKAEEVKRSTGEVEKDFSEYPSQEQRAPESNISPHDSTGILPDPKDQPAEHGIQKSKPLNTLLDDPIVSEVSDLSSSFTGRRILTHLHTLKQLVASKTSLVNMEFGEYDLVQAAKLLDNLNATACFYTAALRLLSKADWQEPVDFEEHIAHQAMIAVARGWTTAIGVKALPFDKYYLALSMATLPLAAHGEVKRTYDNIVATLPSPFREKTSSKVAFSCRVCGKKASHDIPTFIVLEPLEVQADSHNYFKAAVPWTENLLPAAQTSLCDALPNCQECAFDSSWVIESESSCKLVWLQTPREFHPQALLYTSFLGKDPFFAMGRSWKCVSVVVHQGRDPLNGADQPSEHFYVLENDGPKSDYFCYNNAVGLHYVEDTKIKPGDRICAFLFRTADITTKWPVHCTLPNRKQQKIIL